MNPISIYLNKVHKFFATDFMEFVAGYKKSYPKIKVLQSKDDKMYYGFFPGETTGEFKYDKDDGVLYTDLSQTQVYQFVRKGAPKKAPKEIKLTPGENPNSQFKSQDDKWKKDLYPEGPNWTGD